MIALTAVTMMTVAGAMMIAVVTMTMRYSAGLRIGCGVTVI
jgi:hypothetical protein